MDANLVATPLAIPRKEQSSLFAVALTVSYAVLLAPVAYRHEMFRDEMQSWLLARDSRSLVELFHNIRYEGHPALWFLILYPLTRLSWNPVSMQVVNGVFAIAGAWLVASTRQLSRLTRALLVFSFYLFYGYGVIARDYMLPTLLLMGAARCLLDRHKRRNLAIVLLALAVNAHFFAIPIALGLYLGIFCFDPARPWSENRRFFSSREFYVASGVLLAALAASYFTLRAPADRSMPMYGLVFSHPVSNYLVAEGRAWQVFVPYPEPLVPDRYRDLLVPRSHPSALASVFSLAMIVLAGAALRTTRARVFFLGLAVVEFAAFSLTVRVPSPRHYGFLFLGFVLAMLIDACASEGKIPRWPPGLFAARTIMALLLMQVIANAAASAADLVFPFSAGKLTSAWLKANGYDRGPLVLEPDSAGTVVLGYLERSTAYYPACGCFGSFVRWKQTWDHYRVVTRQELDTLAAGTHQPVVVVSTMEFDPHTVSDLRLQPLHFFDRHIIFSQERSYIYMHPAQ